MGIICRFSVGLIFGQSDRTEIAFLLHIKAIVRVLSNEIAILMYKNKQTKCCWTVLEYASWVKSESLNRRYLSFCFLNILA